MHIQIYFQPKIHDFFFPYLTLYARIELELKSQGEIDSFFSEGWAVRVLICNSPFETVRGPYCS